MDLHSTLRVTAGQVSEAGARPVNEDCMGLRVPSGTLLALKGVAAVVADGVSAAAGGREASEICVQSFLNDYYSTPESWTVKTSAHRVLTALNHWLYSRGRSFRDAEDGFLTTLSAVVIKGRLGHLFHVGDTRIGRVRGASFELLTTDHAVHLRGDRTYLGRALGMDVNLHIDYREVPLQEGDVLVLTTDGVHDYLAPDDLAKRIHEAVAAAGPAAEAAESAGGAPAPRVPIDWDRVCGDILDAASRAGSPDNLTCQIIRVESLPNDDAEPIDRALLALPFPPPLHEGMRIDGYYVEGELHASSRSQVYLVRHEATGRRLVMKTPSVNFEDDPGYIERFVMEPWIGRRIRSPHVAQVADMETAPKWLYYLQEYIEGKTLAKWVREHPKADIREVLRITDQIAKGLLALHKRETYHRDLKPDNILIGSDGIVRLIDFGSCYVSGLQELEGLHREEIPLGTERYSAPEVARGESSGVRGDLFSLACIVYEMLTGTLPYGEESEKSRLAWIRSARYVSSTEHNPMVPAWMDAALRRALALDPRERYLELSEFLYDLRHPNASLPIEHAQAISDRQRADRWRNVAVGMLLLYIVTLAWWAG